MKFIFTAATITFLFTLLLSLNSSVISKYHQSFNSIYWSSVNPPAAKTGAPGEGTCTSCHSGTAQAAAGTIDVTFSGTSNEYVVGQTYTFSISIATGTKNGFEATILDASNLKAGTFTSGTNYGLTTSSGKQYVRQNSSVGITSWTINWTAPSTDMGDLTMYYTFNKSNAAGNTSGDVIYVGQYHFSSAIFNTITPFETADRQISLWYNTSQLSLEYNYTLEKTSIVVLQVHDLTGKLITQYDAGIQTNGQYSGSVQNDFSDLSGVYLVSLLIDNNVFTRKLIIP